MTSGPEFVEPHVASLDPSQLSKVQELEKQLGEGVCVIAYERAVQPASLSPKQLADLQAAEKQLGRCLVAYRMTSRGN